MSRVAITESVLYWAVSRSGRNLDSLEGKFPRIQEWANGASQPTLRQLESLAKATLTPLGYLLLKEPPVDRLPISHFRTQGDETPGRPSPDLIETVHTMQLRQAWMREFMVEQGNGRLEYVGSATLVDGPIELADQMRSTVGLNAEWAAGYSTWTDALGALRRAMEDEGVLVVLNGVVGNNTSRKLDPGEFRGFVLVDDYAPLVFVNNADAKSAQMFTLAHELAHLFLGSSAAFDLRGMQPADDPTEQLCNRAAAEFLVPSDLMQTAWQETRGGDTRFQVMARRFKVSEIVAARRALDLKLITTDEFRDFYRGNQANRNPGPSGGGNFYANQNFRVGRPFAAAVVQATREGNLLYSEAYRLTGLYGKTFEEYAAHIETGGSTTGYE